MLLLNFLDFSFEPATKYYILPTTPPLPQHVPCGRFVDTHENRYDVTVFEAAGVKEEGIPSVKEEGGVASRGRSASRSRGLLARISSSGSLLKDRGTNKVN